MLTLSCLINVSPSSYDQCNEECFPFEEFEKYCKIKYTFRPINIDGISHDIVKCLQRSYFMQCTHAYNIGLEI